MWYNFFDKVYCLSQPDRPEERQLAALEFSRIGFHVNFFDSLTDEQPLRSFCRSQHAMLKQSLEDGNSSSLHLEDDCIFKDMTWLMHSLTELPADWDVVYLGANLFGDGFQGHMHKYSKHLYKINLAWTSHAIGYSRKMIEWLVNNYDPMSGAMFDNYLSNRLHLFQSFVVNPMVAWQRPRKSDLWGKEVDYTGCFIEGNKLMLI